MSDPITVSALLAEPELSSYSRERFVTDFADVIELDFAGRQCVARDIAKEILDELRATAATIAEQQAQRRAAAAAAKHGTSIATLRRRLRARRSSAAGACQRSDHARVGGATRRRHRGQDDRARRT